MNESKSFIIYIYIFTNIMSDSDDDTVMEYMKKESKIEKTEEELNQEEIQKDNIILGIDLGTTNSCISIWRNGTCEIIPDEYGNRTIPSFVSYTNINKYVGHEAKKQKDINPENVFYEVKRLIGRDYDDNSVQEFKKLVSYNIIKNDRGQVSLQSTVRDNKTFTPEEISACVLMKLKDMAQKYLKRQIKDVVITVPAHFNDSQRQATKDSATIAGLNCVRMFHEPTACALAYGMLDRSVNKALNSDTNNNDDDKKGMLILVYDFGGGTLDVSLIDIYDGIFDVQASSGISHFGGVDFDNRLITFCMTKFSRQFYGKSILEIDKISRVSLQRLRTQCESAKKILSTNFNAVIAVENFHEEKDLFVKISRNDFENICRDYFLLCLHPVDELLKECGKSESDIDEVILVGGMTRMPYIRELLNNKFRKPDGTSKVNCSINPDEAVSVGASIQGYILSHSDDAFSNSVTLMDVTPLSLGVEVIGGIMDILIKRNTMIPCEKVKLYSTDTDNVDSVLIKIFEGERQLTKFNCKIGEFELDKIPCTLRGIPEIEICFSIDLNGIVTVTAFEKDVNEKKSIIVNTNKNGLKPHQIRQLVEEAIEQETSDEIERTKKFTYYEIEDLCSNIKANINNKEFKLKPKDIELIDIDVENVIKWLKEKSYKDRDLDEFETVLDKMKKKYGVLILQGKVTNNNVKPKSEELDATTLYNKDDDEEEEDMKQAFEKVEREELGVTGMSDAEILEIKEMRDNLMDLCRTISNIIYSGKMNIDNDHKREILNYIDDIMMWYYSHEKPTKIDYKEKIDYINSICDEIVNKYDTEGKELFNKGELENENDKYSMKLEKLCLTLITMLDNKQINGSRASLSLFDNKLKRILKYVYQNIDNQTEEYQKQCAEYINEINDTCNEIYNNTHNIYLNQEPIISVKQIQISEEKEEDDRKGTDIMDILRMKQNDEMNKLIEEQI